MDRAIRDNGAMQKELLRQILAANIERAMKEAGLETQPQLAKKAKIGQSHVSRLLRGQSAATVDILADLAEALKMQPWELLADSETTRRAAVERMLLGPRITNERAAEHLPPAPGIDKPAKKKAAPKRKRKRPEEGSNG